MPSQVAAEAVTSVSDFLTWRRLSQVPLITDTSGAAGCEEVQLGGLAWHRSELQLLHPSNEGKHTLTGLLQE